jgi:hypothetical protein
MYLIVVFVSDNQAQTMTAAVIDNTKQVTADAADAVANAVSTTVMQVKEASKNSSFAKGALAAGETVQFPELPLNHSTGILNAYLACKLCACIPRLALTSRFV